MNKHKAIAIFILCLSLLLVVGYAQRGGGGGSSRSSGGSRGSSSRSSHFWSKSSRKSKNDVDFLTIFGLNPKKQAKLNLFNTVKLWIFRAIFAVVGISFLYSGYTANRDNKIFSSVRSIFFQFKYKKKREPPTMSKKQSEAFIDSLKSKAFNMTFRQKDKHQSWSCKMKISFTIKLSKAVYEAGLKGADDFGSFKMEGPLALTKEGIQFMFLKKYDDSRTSGQTGTFQYLIYEGCGTIDQCQGKWAYFGHENEDKYNGTWIMTSQNE